MAPESWQAVLKPEARFRTAAWPLCAICARHRATTITELDGRKHPACGGCVSPVSAGTTAPHKPSSPLKLKVVRVVRGMPGASSFDIASALGQNSESARNHVSQVLTRLVKAGVLVAQGGKKMARTYRLAPNPPAFEREAGKRRVYQCTRCGGDGHNRAKCFVDLPGEGAA